MKVTSLLLSLLVFVVSCKTCQGVPSKNPDGSIIWDPLPSLGSFVVEPDEYKTDGNRLATLANMARGWVNVLQPKGFPIDYAVHLIEIYKGEEVDIIDEVFLGMENFIGIVICVLIGVFFFLLLPLIALFFFCCRCCGNCGGKREQEPSSLCCEQICLSICLASPLAVLCAGAVCIDFSNTFMSRAKDATFQTSFDVLGDLQTFTTGSSRQLGHILEDEYKYAEDLTFDDLNSVGRLVAEPIEEYLQVSTLFNEFEELIRDLNDTQLTLLRMNVSRTFLIESGEILGTRLELVSKDLDDINTTCTGCVPPNQGLAVNVDFTQLPALDDQISGSDTAIADVNNLYDQGVKTLDQMAIDIGKAAEEPINDVETVINSASAKIAEVYTEANDQLVALVDSLDEYEKFMKDRLDVTNQYIIYRDYAMLALSLLCFLIFGIFVVGLIMGSIFSKNVDPRYRSNSSNCCGNFLMIGVVLTFLLTPFLMILTSAFFGGLAPATLTCKPLKNLKLINETIDQPDLISDGYILGDIILGNSSIPLTFTSILEDCEHNATIYNTLKLDHVFNVNELKKIIPELRNQTDKLIDEIDIGDVDLSDLVPDDLRLVLQYSVDQIQLDQIDFDAMEALLQKDLVTDDLLAYSIELETAADNNPDVADDLRGVVSTLKEIHYAELPTQDSMASMLSDTQHIQALIPQLDRGINDTTKAGLVVEAILLDTQGLEAELDQSVENYIDVVIGYMEQFIDVAVEQFTDEFGRCYPVRAIYDATINLMCHYNFDSLNTAWFSLGWCTVWMVISLIFAIKLAKYLRIMYTIPKQRADSDLFGRTGTYMRPHADTIRSLDNQAYHDYYGYQHDDQEMVNLPSSTSQTRHANVTPSAPSRTPTTRPRNPPPHPPTHSHNPGPPPSYEDAIKEFAEQQRWL